MWSGCLAAADGEGISKREKRTIWQSGEEHYLDNMIRFGKIIGLLSVVLAVDSEDKFEQCALVNELVEKGKVRCVTSLLFNLVVCNFLW